MRLTSKGNDIGGGGGCSGGYRSTGQCAAGMSITIGGQFVVRVPPPTDQAERGQSLAKNSKNDRISYERRKHAAGRRVLIRSTVYWRGNDLRRSEITTYNDMCASFGMLAVYRYPPPI